LIQKFTAQAPTLLPFRHVDVDAAAQAARVAAVAAAPARINPFSHPFCERR